MLLYSIKKNLEKLLICSIVWKSVGWVWWFAWNGEMGFRQIVDVNDLGLRTSLYILADRLFFFLVCVKGTMCDYKLFRREWEGLWIHCLGNSYTFSLLVCFNALHWLTMCSLIPLFSLVSQVSEQSEHESEEQIEAFTCPVGSLMNFWFADSFIKWLFV